ncbi:MAG TPA: sulfoxide reductase heme-binding subunit YedZ, partial [Candidatus Eisenbacteria bacterium]|nr:sulfoxide reductase heme-binding subunit YedZ [Candidatus Eisenbacteria bacterium]
WSIRKLGKHWQNLHRLIYFSAAAGVIHYIWLVKADLKKPLEYAAVLGLLLLYRVVGWVKNNVAVVSKVRAPEVNG